MPQSVYTDAYSTLVDVLVSHRRRSGLTQAELAERLGRPQSFVSKVEQRQRRVDVIEFCAIARALEVDPAKLFGELLVQIPAQLRV
ncbi:MAG: XRE family transcriptional regulator [Phenylobacterium sp.]|uniref:helix-turn-helix domain-containing protein n=1 Tax=Phenylobacterium sp. TaxID=1871053 RepID=UPI0025E807DD|nr:helix-turn-helix transcriptional regulator [Phenylobacterium sp.]MBA4010761.1 XRE family transcriptional regulator [Phenylobacterium sp.]